MPHSLKSKKMIQSLLTSGKKYSAPILVMYRSTNIDNSVDNYKVAYLLSKKAGGAVERNRIKRWLREDFRSLQKETPLRGLFALRFRSEADKVVHTRLKQVLSELYKAVENG